MTTITIKTTYDHIRTNTMITISQLHEFVDKYAPDCSERRVLHLALERLSMFEAGQIPELKAQADAQLRRMLSLGPPDEAPDGH